MGSLAGSDTILKAVAVLNSKKVDRSKRVLKAKPQVPLLSEYVSRYQDRLVHSGKSAGTQVPRRVL